MTEPSVVALTGGIYALLLTCNLHLLSSLPLPLTLPPPPHLASSSSSSSAQKPKQKDWHPPDGFILGLWTLILLVFFKTYGIKHLKHIFWGRRLHVPGYLKAWSCRLGAFFAKGILEVQAQLVTGLFSWDWKTDENDTTAVWPQTLSSKWCLF